MKNTPLKVGVVGLGIFFNKRHLPAFLKLPKLFQISSVYTSSQKKFSTFKKNYPNAQHVKSLDELLEQDLDLVITVVPIPKLYDIGLKVVQSGKHLVMEKPLTANSKQARSLMALAKKKGVKVFVTENFRFLKVFHKCKELMQKGTLGRVRMVQISMINFLDRSNPYLKNEKSWRLNPKGYSGILLDGGIHIVSLLRFFFSKIKLLYRYQCSFNKDLGSQDTAFMHLKTDGLDTYLTLSYSLKSSSRELMKIFCKRGVFSVSGKQLSVEKDYKKKKVYDYVDDEYVSIYKEIYADIKNKKDISFSVKEAYQDIVMFEKLFIEGIKS